MKGVILAGGSGSRLSPLTHVTNKHLLPVYNKPMIYYPIETLKALGLKDIIIVTGGNSVGDIVDLISSKTVGFRDLNFSFIYQDRPLGIAHGVQLVENHVGVDEPFAVILGDNIFTDHYTEEWEKFLRSDEYGHVFLKEVAHPERFGVAALNSNLQIKRIDEKPLEPESTLAVTGLYFYRPEVFPLIHKLTPSNRRELEITDLHNAICRKKKLGYDMIYGFWSDAGTFESLFNASSFIRGAFGNI